MTLAPSIGFPLRALARSWAALRARPLLRRLDPIAPAFVAMARQAARADRHLRQRMQDNGVDVLPVTFYSNTPSLADIAGSFEYAEDAPYLNPDVFRPDVLREWLERLAPLSADFRPPVDGDPESGVYFWRNDQFSWSDAAAYYAMLRHLRPARVVEIGAGFSTLVAHQALKDNGAGRITCVEPYPREFLRRMDVDLRTVPAQSVTADDLNALLADGDVLFIDSTHTVKTGSDCLHIYLRLLPAIRRRVFIHVHDIFLPFGMPREWVEDLHIHWTEQYLLMAWLLDNPRASLIYGSAYNERFQPELLLALMHERYPGGGSSVWVEYDGRR